MEASWLISSVTFVWTEWEAVACMLAVSHVNLLGGQWDQFGDCTRTCTHTHTHTGSPVLQDAHWQFGHS